MGFYNNSSLNYNYRFDAVAVLLAQRRITQRPGAEPGGVENKNYTGNNEPPLPPSPSVSHRTKIRYGSAATRWMCHSH